MTHTVHLADRAVLRIGGPEARDFLQGLLTNDLATLAPASPLWAGLLSAQGKALFEMLVHDAGDDILLDVAADRAADLAKRLAMFRLRRPVIIGPSDLNVFAAWDGAAGHPADPRTALLGERWLADTAATTADPAAYHSHRMAVGVPDAADILVDKTLWLEANAVELHGVSFTKGCYVGQENTARMHHRDRVRRRLLPVVLTGDPGDGRIHAGDREAGELRSHAGDRGIAWLRMEPVEAGAPLTMNGAATGVAVAWPDWLPRP